MMDHTGMALTQPWGPAEFAGIVLMWALMMIAMMLPSVSPVFLLFARARAGNGGNAAVSTTFFAAGYFLVWIGFSIGAAGLQLGLHTAALLTSGSAISNPLLAGAVLVGAGAFQFSPLKHRCLSHCRNPLGSLMSHWRSGRVGALAMGTRHGKFCLGCCWVEMLVLFVVGVMNFAWIVLLAAFVVLEKLGPRGDLAARAGGAVMIAAGIALIAA